MMTESERIDSKVYGMAYSASKDWFRRACINPAATMYFWYKPGQISFYLGEEGLNGDYVKAVEEPVSSGRSTEQTRAWIREIARSLPILS